MVRKRKNSSEEVTAPAASATRLTRQRRNLDEEGDPDASSIEKSTKSSKTPKTPSTRRRTARKKTVDTHEEETMSTRSRRALVIKSSSDSDVENRSENTLKKEKLNDKDKELNSVESYPTRSRARRDANATIIQDLTILTNEINEAEASFPEPRKVTRKKRILTTAADNTIAENSSSSPLKYPSKATRSHAKSNPSIKINEIHDLQEPENGKKETVGDNPKNLKNLSIKRIVETPRKVSPRRGSSSLIKISNDTTITPESSPMLVNLTPNRSTKTPKKSPMSIGSPKTHSQSPLRLSKTPRKLTVAVESPATSDKSSISTTTQSPRDKMSQNANRHDPFVVLTDFVKEASPWNDKNNLIDSPQSFTSSVTLTLKKPFDKSTNESNNSSFLTVDEIWAEVSAVSPNKKKSPVNKKPAILASKIRKSPIKSPSSYSSTRRTEALISTAATPSNKRLSTVNRTPKKTPITIKQNIVNPESPRRPKSTIKKKRSPFTSSGTPLRPIDEIKNNVSASVVSLPCVIAPKKIKQLLDIGVSSPESTPRGRIRRSLHLTPDFIKFSSDSTSSPIETPANRKSGRINTSPIVLANDSKDSKILENESLELINSINDSEDNDDVFINSVKQLDGTYELEDKEGEKKIDEVEKDKTEIDNETYELDEPKTPSLKKNNRKRSISNVEPDKFTPDAKKRCRVRFASPGVMQNDRNSANVSTPLRSKRRTLLSNNVVGTPARERTAGRLSARGNLSGIDSSRRRSRSLTKINEKNRTDGRISAKRRSISASDLTNKTPKLNQSTQNSVNRLSRPRQSFSSDVKLEIKLPAARKAPNFAQIHQKKFAEMESLVDAKKRVAKRHEELNSAVPSSSSSSLLISATRASQQSSASSSSSANILVPESSSQQTKKIITKKPVPSDSKTGEFNRFGFKLRKIEAVKIVSKKPPSANRSRNHQEDNRSILKGVRTNKRFELQMKMRNLKP